MPRPAGRSGTLKGVWKKAPGGSVTLHFSRKSPSSAACASCGGSLSGIQRGRKSSLNTARSRHKPSRPYGGYLCPQCARDAIKVKMLKGFDYA